MPIHQATPPEGRNRLSPRAVAAEQLALRPAYYCLALVVLAAPQLLGGVFATGIVVIAAGAVAALGLTAHVLRRNRLVVPATGPVLGVIAALVWTALQLMPLPCTFVERISPDAVNALRASMSALEQTEPPWCELSRAPGNTRIELLKGIAIAAAFITAHCLSFVGARRSVLRVVALSSLTMCIVALGHRAVDARSVFGVYRPLHANPPLLAPLMNPNTLGGFMAMGVPLLVGLDARETRPVLRVLWFLSAIVMTAAVLLSRSRGAIAALGGAVTLFGIIALISRLRRRGIRHEGTRLPAAGLVAVLGIMAGVGLGLYASSEALTQEFVTGGLDKLELIRRGFAFSLGAPLVGIGRGAFSAVFVPTHSLSARFEYAENFPVQWSSEWGIPFTVALIGVLGHALWKAVKATRSPAHLGACVAVVLVVTHNQFDLGLELLGVAVVTAALLGATLAPRHGGGSGASAPRLSGVLPWLIVFALALLAAIAPTANRTHAPELLRAVDAATSTAPGEVVPPILRRAMRLHPSEPMFPLFAASQAVARGNAAALRLIQRALQTAPKWTAPHVLAARWSWSHGDRDGAIRELRAAAALNADGLGDLLCTILRQDADVVLQAAPHNAERLRFLERSAICLPQRSPAAAALDSAILREFPQALAPRIRQASRSAAAGDHDAAVSQLQALAQGQPESWEICHRLARAQRAAGRGGDALTTLQGCAAASDDLRGRRALVTERATIEADLGLAEDMRRSVAELVHLGRGEPEAVARAMAVGARLEEKLGNHLLALGTYERAHAVSPSDEVLRHVGRLARRLGRTRRAIQVFSQLCSLSNGYSKDCDTLRELDTGAGR